MKRALFLDRDGVVNKRAALHEYIRSPDSFEFLPGAVDALSALCAAGFELFIITNQAGVGKNLMSEADLEAIHAKMQNGIKEKGAYLAGIYYCPHVPEDECDCRKPKPGLILRAAREHNIDLSKAIFVGDDERDAQAAAAAGVAFINVSTDIGVAAAYPELSRMSDMI